MAAEQKGQPQTYSQVDADEAIRAWDLDGDGHINALEMVVAHDKQVGLERSSYNSKKMVCMVLSMCLVVIATMLAVTILANELSKDSKPDSQAVLRDNNNKVVQAESMVSKNLPLDEILLDLKYEEIATILSVDLYHQRSDTYYHLKISGFKKNVVAGEARITLYPTSPMFQRVTVRKNLVVLVTAGNESLTISVPPTTAGGRRLLAANGATSVASFAGHITSKHSVKQLPGQGNNDSPPPATKCFCALNKLYQASFGGQAPAFNAITYENYPPYSYRCVVSDATKTKYLSEGGFEGASNGAAVALLSTYGQNLVAPNGAVGIHNMKFDDECQIEQGTCSDAKIWECFQINMDCADDVCVPTPEN